MSLAPQMVVGIEACPNKQRLTEFRHAISCLGGLTLRLLKPKALSLDFPMFTTVDKSPLTLVIDHVVALHLSFVDGPDKLDKVGHTNLDKFEIMISLCVSPFTGKSQYVSRTYTGSRLHLWIVLLCCRLPSLGIWSCCCSVWRPKAVGERWCGGGQQVR